MQIKEKENQLQLLLSVVYFTTGCFYQSSGIF